MGKRDKRIDAYIAKSAAFAQPILREIREIVHEACPDAAEDMKWSMPHFMYKGMLCGMAAFKQHATFGFWKGSLVLGEGQKSEEAMGQFGALKSVKDLPARRTMLGYVKEAARLNDLGIKVASKPKPKAAKAEVEVPDYFVAALKKNKAAIATFTAFTYSKRKEYVEWLAEAKTEATRQRRLEQSIEWLAEGKSRHWKYQNC